jgi:hypothetical protein
MVGCQLGRLAVSRPVGGRRVVQFASIAAADDATLATYEESSSFLEKRTKKLLFRESAPASCPTSKSVRGARPRVNSFL